MKKNGVGYASVTDLEKRYVLDALDSQRLSQGKYVAQFEKRFAEMHGQSYGVMCNSGTGALHLALEALKEVEGWDSETEVLVPAITFIATPNAVLHAGMKPVFVDVDMTTYNMDVEKIEQCIGEHTKCIIPVHCFGLPCDMDRIVSIAKKHDLRIIEDCAESHFASIKGKTVGSFSDIMACSTYVAHTITTGVGGIMCTSDPRLAEILRSLVAHGRACTCERCIASDGEQVCPKRMQTDIDRRFMFVRLGYSYRVGELEGALGLAQLERSDEIMEARKRNAEHLIRGLEPFEHLVQLPRHAPDMEHTYMMFPVLIKEKSGLERDDFVRFLESRNIETRPMLPLLNQPIYKELFGDKEKDYPVAWYINANGFYVGCHHGLTHEDIDRQIEVFADYLGKR
ncbi:DegT/DnrJ/EryC1/StrS family aminotransferase [Gordonibacter massiliensis (ex Traore et al. 2017)]|uniref:DegT/DnrJ/EryC1/StrS family aminotransferase n=1 Tax=Gordonibacter massiliensis (ex Traore et al. 2017) TaxID=1841863 RepID=UPI001C8CD98C|nr:DegT/DnrJ/EryC1/StrS family aminotransferase [Gordonibacter massiliensis (ex Traore et al. 2017)]MBX9033735.1 DegT/DnrJ/EryC1/StrS family aminotransferase [Gordonibacter massiliensis (ex Traore et al. 2017)]